jgi:ABC-2 type transport system permease protein
MVAVAQSTGLARTASAKRMVALVRSEFTKIRTVRSTYLTLIVLVVITAGLSCIISWATAAHWARESASARASFDPTDISLTGFFLGQLFIAAFGALALTAEYSSGMISATLTAQPRRLDVYAAKALVVAAVALVTGLIAGFISFFACQAILASTHASAKLADPGVLRSVIGSGLFLAVCALFAFGIAALLKSSAGAISAAIGLLFVPPLLVTALPTSLSQDISRWLPSQAGSALLDPITQAHQFTAWTGFGLFCVYTALLVGAGFMVFNQRDS